MSKNQPSLLARGRFVFWNFFFGQTQNGRCLLDSLSMVGVAGFEPATLRLSSACSNQLSYTPLISAGKVWWRHGDSNPRPIACKATALPTELCPQKWVWMDSNRGSAAGRIGNRSKN